MFSRILIATDGSDVATAAVLVGTGLARALNAALALVHVVDPSLAATTAEGISASELLDDLRREGAALLQRARAMLPEGEGVEALVREGRPGHEIVAAAHEWGADLVVIGSHGRTGLRRLLFGSTAEAVVRQAPCAVLTIRRGADASPGVGRR